MDKPTDAAFVSRYRTALLGLLTTVLIGILWWGLGAVDTPPGAKIRALHGFMDRAVSPSGTRKAQETNRPSGLVYTSVVMPSQEVTSTVYLPALLRAYSRPPATATPTPPPETQTPTATATDTWTPTATPTASQTPPPTPMSVVSPWSIDMGGRATDPTLRDLAVVAGFRFHRTSVSWGNIEPGAPVDGERTYHWPDSAFDVYRNDPRLIPIVFVFAPNPSWAVPSGQRTCGPIDPAHLDDFREFVYQLVSRYTDVTRYWGFYNEEDQWTGLTDDNAGGCWGRHGADYAQMLGVAWEAAHSANPDVQVIFGAAAYEPVWDGGAHWDRFFFRDAFQYMQANSPPGDDYVDIIMANQYTHRRDDWDGGANTLPQNQDIMAKFKQAVSDAAFDPNVPDAYSIARWQAAYGLDKPMAASEVGLQVSVGCADVPTCEELQARQAVHVNVRGLAAGLRFITWYTLVDKPSDPFNYGLLRDNLTPRPAYTAYQVMTKQLDGYMFDQQLVIAGKPYIQAYRFDRNGGKKLVLWRDTGVKLKDQDNSATEMMTVSATEFGEWTGAVRVTDKMGNATVVSGVSSVDLAFSSDPIYVEVVE